MKVGLVSYTHNPEQVVSLAAGTCYNRSDYSYDRVRNCYRRGHMSVFEHASVTFSVEGISRSCSHQLVRHRLASYTQQSQRYVRINTSSDDWYVIPPSIKEASPCTLKEYKDAMRNLAEKYWTMMKSGINPEDARFILPEATKTSVIVTMNYRELLHFFDLRLDKHAQWEIRELANKMLEALNVAGPALKDIYVQESKKKI